jgi:hypothetical protein
VKPVIVGMNNPLSGRSEHALYPFPEGCTGHRLWVLLNKRTGASQEDYLEAFERRNLLNERVWNLNKARDAASKLILEMRGRTVLVLGAEVRTVLKLPVMLVHPQELWGVTWRQLPHPSGRNPWYMKAGNREVAELLLEELFRLPQLGPREPMML